MPSVAGKLYLAVTLEQLNEKAELPPNILKSKPEMLARIGGQVYKQAEKSLELRDEEKAYLNFMKYLNLYTVVKGSLAYKKDKAYYNSMFASWPNALTHAEKLSDSLKHRYEEKQAESVAAKMATRQNNTSSSETGVDPTAESKSTVDTTDSTNGTINGDKVISPSLTPVELYNSIETVGGGQILLIDIQPANRYDDSHIRLDSVDVLHISADHIIPGILASKLRGKLSTRSQSLFDARANYKGIVLLDWESNYSELTSSHPLCVLKDVLYKYDQQISLACEPQILDGGYKEWVKFYPMFSTNPSVRDVSLPKSVIDIPDVSSISYDLDFDKVDPPPSPGGQGESVTHPPNKFPAVDRSNKPNSWGQTATSAAGSATSAAGTATSAQTNGVRLPGGSNSDSQNSQPPSSGGGVSSHTPPLTSNPTLPTAGPVHAGVPPASVTTPSSIPDVKAAVSNGVFPHPNSAIPSVNRNLKPSAGSQPPVQQVNAGGLSESDKRTEEELYTKLKEQNRRMIVEAGDRIKQLNEDRAQVADLTKLKQSESQALAELMRQKKLLEQEIAAQQQKIAAAKEVQEQHEVTNKPEINRNLKPNLEDWERRLAELEIGDPKSNGDLQKISVGTGNLESKLGTEEQSRLIGEQNRQIRQEQAKREAERAKLRQQQEDEKARLAEEQRMAAEKARLAEEQSLAAEKARLAEEQRVAAEKARLAEEQRLAAEKARLAEEQRLASEKARLAEEQRLAAEAEKQRLEAEQRKQTEEKRQIEAKAVLKQQEARRKSAEIARNVSTNELPPGWQRKLNEQGAIYYINHATGVTSSTPPKPQPVPQKPAPAAAATKPTLRAPGSPQAMRSTMRLKSDETTFGADGQISSNREVKARMKRSSSIPNLSQLHDDVAESKPAPVTLDRSNKPPAMSRQQSIIQTPTIDKRRLANLSPEYGNTVEGLTGLYNMGNTCYMNSALQCLSHTLPLVKYFTGDMYTQHINSESSKGSKGAITSEFAFLLKFLWAGYYKYIVPRDFKFVFGRKQTTFDHFKQMDSQEFLQILLDMFHEDLNSKGHLEVKAKLEDSSKVSEDVAAKLAYDEYRRSNDSIIVTLFTGLQRGVTFCTNCNEKSYKFESYNFLPLEIATTRRTSLNSCLDQYLRVDPLEDYTCEKCHRKQSKRKLDLYSLPVILLVFFKRFDQYSYHFAKKTNMIDFPEDLTLHSLTESKRYSLYGVVNHYGSLDSGHYTSFCKSMKTKKWHKFNDESVSVIRNSGDIKSSAAYILFYTSLSSNVL